MFGMIRRYLKGRARIIAKRQLAQGVKKVARSVMDRNDKENNATKGKKMIVSRVQERVLAFIVSIGIIVAPMQTFATTGIVHDPQSFAQSYAQFVESIEKYNNMIKTAQDSLDTLNRVNDIMNTASNQLNNLQVGLADPRQLKDRFESNIKAIQENAKRIAKNLEEKDWANAFHNFEYASCKTKWKKVKEEYKKYQQEKASKNLQDELDKNDGSEEAQERIDNARNKFNEKWNEKENTIEKGIGLLETVEKDGVQAGISKIHEWANAAQKYIDVKNNEYVNPEAAIRPINKYKIQANICRDVKETELLFIIAKNEKEFIQNKILGRERESEKNLEEIRKAQYNLEMEKYKRTKNVFKNATEYFTQNPADTLLAGIDVNEETGELIGDWKESLGTDKEPTKDDVAIKEPIPQTDANGNTTTIHKWLAKPETIEKLFNRNKIADALNLQNKRNMVLALQGDTQAIQKAQAETMMMLSRQINTLNNGINQLGMLSAEFLNQRLDEKEQYQENYQNRQNYEDKFRKSAIEATQTYFGNFDDYLEVKESGRLKVKDTNKDTSGILGD